MHTNQIKILFLLKKKDRGGIYGYQDIMLRIFNKGPSFKLYIIDEKAKNRIYQFLQSIRVIHILFDYVYLMPKVIKYRKDVDYLFIPHHFKYGLFAVLVSSLFKIPFIVPIFGYTEIELKLKDVKKIERFIQLKYEYWIFSKAKYLLSSDDLINEYNKIIKNKNKFLSFYCLIDTNKFKPMPKSETLKNDLGIANKKVILTVTGFRHGKGVGLKILLEAFVLIKKEYKNVILLIAGWDPEIKEYKELVKVLNIEDDVMFLGYCDNIPELMNISDIFTLIFAFGGGIGSTVMEAMACEKACIISRTPGTEILNDEEVLLVNLDPREIADKIMLVLKDEEYARRIAINAKKRAEADFSIERAEDKLIKKLGGEDL